MRLITTKNGVGRVDATSTVLLLKLGAEIDGVPKDKLRDDRGTGLIILVITGELEGSRGLVGLVEPVRLRKFPEGSIGAISAVVTRVGNVLVTVTTAVDVVVTNIDVMRLTGASLIVIFTSPLTLNTVFASMYVEIYTGKTTARTL